MLLLKCRPFGVTVAKVNIKSNKFSKECRIYFIKPSSKRKEKVDNGGNIPDIRLNGDQPFFAISR